MLYPSFHHIIEALFVLWLFLFAVNLLIFVVVVVDDDVVVVVVRSQLFWEVTSLWKQQAQEWPRCRYILEFE